MAQDGAQKRIQVLDGGMGTTLQALGHDVSSALWGCDLLTSDPSALARVHRDFAHAGADLVETATYQLTLGLLCDHAKMGEAAGTRAMQSAIPLAADSSHRRVVLSVGPFGATLCPGQEYAGIYPPPYGPVQDEDATADTNLFADAQERRRAVEHLEQFHLDRLNVFADDDEAWSRIEWIAFETVPVLTEYEAARRAMGHLYARGKGKRFWITSAYPDGRHGQHASTSFGRAQVRDIVYAAVGGDSDRLPLANGIGFNCTNPAYATTLADEFAKELVALRQRGEARKGLAFVVYPDGGCVYNLVERTWSSDKLDPVSWATQIAAIARKMEAEQDGGEHVWESVIVGGCCKAGFEEIRALRHALDSWERRCTD